MVTGSRGVVKKSAPLFTLSNLYTLVTFLYCASLLYSNFTLYLYALVTKTFHCTPVTFSCGGPCFNCCLVACMHHIV